MPHISHLVDDRSLSLGTIKEIVRTAMEGNLSEVTEKLDGVNISFTVTSKYEVRFARSNTDIKNGGMSLAVLEAKFTGRGIVQDTFVLGGNAIRAATRALTVKELSQAFEDGKIWYSAEIIYTKNANVVHYKHDCVVIHRRPIVRSELGELRDEPTDRFACVERVIVEMDEAARAVGWRVYGPQNVKLSPLDGTSQHALHASLDEIVASMGGAQVTLQSYLEQEAKKELSTLGVTGRTLDVAALRLAEAPGSLSLTALKSKLPQRAITTLRDSDKWIATKLEPLEKFVLRFGAQLLASAESALIADNTFEARRISDKLNESIDVILKSRNQTAIDILDRQLAKLNNERVVTTPVEGVVFPWEDKIYKLTGVFGPVNAILGLRKYGRGKAVPPLSAI